MGFKIREGGEMGGGKCERRFYCIHEKHTICLLLSLLPPPPSLIAALSWGQVALVVVPQPAYRTGRTTS